MASFEVRVVPITVEDHPNADALELARVGGYLSVIPKGRYKTGDLVAYIPEQAVVPEDIQDELGLKGRLAGPEMNRVKAISLRGILSQGLVYPARPEWAEGQDVSGDLGIVKYVPEVPEFMLGDVWPAGFERCIKYDIENIKRFPDVIGEGEEVVFTEKLHGTWCMVGVLPEKLADAEHGDVVVTSKGMSDKGLAFIVDSEGNEDNIYIRAAKAHDVVAKIRDACAARLLNQPVFVIGEVYGAGVQKGFDYGASAAKDETLGFRVFDVYVGLPGHGFYFSDRILDSFCERAGLERVPVLYRGPFSQKVLDEYTDGKTTLGGKHIREGVVVCPVEERRDDQLGRVKLKSVSPKYLTRKGSVTEYQ